VTALAGTAASEMTRPAAAVQYYDDVAGHWAAGVINRWNALGALEEFPSGTFRPNDYITRAEFFSLVVHAMGAAFPEIPSRFHDVGDYDWHKNSVMAAVTMGLAEGYPDGTMRPGGNLLRQDAATILGRAIGLASDSPWPLSRFTDGSAVSSYAETYVAAFVENGFLGGYPDGTLRPRAFIRRSEAVNMLNNMFPNVYLPELSIHNVMLSGASLNAGVMVMSNHAEITN